MNRKATYAASIARLNKAYCVNGHAFTNDNTRIKPSSGFRDCKECSKLRSKAFRINNPHYMKNYREKNK